MRRLAPLFAVAFAASPALAQSFGQDRAAPPATPAPTAPAPKPPAAPPAPVVTAAPAAPTPPAPAAPVAAVTPSSVAHPWGVQPSSGEWFVCIKSYTGPAAQKHAEELAGIVRTQHNAAAYLYEWGAEERLREEKRRAEMLAERSKEQAPFLQKYAEEKQRAMANGVPFLDAPPTVRIAKLTVSTQWGVLIGGFPNMDVAREAQKMIKTWPAPAQVHLMDRQYIATPGESKPSVETAYINPYANGMVVRNPAVKQAESTATAGTLDPAVVRMNENEPLSILKVNKAWTLVVKDYTTPTMSQDSKQAGTALGRLFAGGTDKRGKMLELTAAQAGEFARMLRSEQMTQSAAEAARRLGMTPRPLDSYILHLPIGSRVFVGQFDSLDDPALEETQRLLQKMSSVKLQERAGAPAQEIQIFDIVTPLPVPKVGPATSPAARK